MKTARPITRVQQALCTGDEAAFGVSGGSRAGEASEATQHV